MMGFEFECGMQPCNGIAESLHAAGVDGRAPSHGQGPHDDAGRWRAVPAAGAMPAMSIASPMGQSPRLRTRVRREMPTDERGAVGWPPRP